MDAHMQTSRSTRVATKSVAAAGNCPKLFLGPRLLGQHKNGTDRFYVEASEIKAFFESV